MQFKTLGLFVSIFCLTVGINVFKGNHFKCLSWIRLFGLTCNYHPQRSCEGHVFTHVCHSVHGGVPGLGGCLVWGVPGPGGCLVRGLGAWSQGGMPGPRGCLVPGGGGIPACTEADPPFPERDGYCCGRYASYWNAFLLLEHEPNTIRIGEI